jgi:hypothetical protein
MQERRITTYVIKQCPDTRDSRPAAERRSESCMVAERVTQVDGRRRPKECQIGLYTRSEAHRQVKLGRAAAVEGKE